MMCLTDERLVSCACWSGLTSDSRCASQVVEEIDCLTSDLRLEEDLTDGSKTDTLNSSSSSTASSVKIYPEETLFRPTASRAEDITPMQNGDSVCRESRCPQSTRERVRFSEKVLYHGYCPHSTDLHLHTELIDSPVHQSSTENAFPSQKPHKTILRKSTSTTVWREPASKGGSFSFER